MPCEYAHLFVYFVFTRPLICLSIQSFNLDAYKEAGDALLKEMSQDFVELFPLETYMNAVKTITNNAIAQYITDEEVYNQFVAEPRTLLLANSYATTHQGLIRKGLATYSIEQQSMFNGQWMELESQTVGFIKGSAVQAGAAAGTDADRFVGFRGRLSSKCAWAYGYLNWKQYELLKKLEKLNMDDPISKYYSVCVR